MVTRGDEDPCAKFDVAEAHIPAENKNGIVLRNIFNSVTHRNSITPSTGFPFLKVFIHVASLVNRNKFNDTSPTFSLYYGDIWPMKRYYAAIGNSSLLYGGRI